MLKREVALLGCTLVTVVALAGTAVADDGWGSVDCTQNPHPGCELGAGKNGGRDASPPTGRSGGSPGGGSESRSDGQGGSGAPETPSHSDVDRADCAYERSDYEPPSDLQPAAYGAPRGREAPAVKAAAAHAMGQRAGAVLSAAPDEKGAGAWYVYKCEVNGVRDAYYRPPIWLPDTPQDDEADPQVSPAALAERAREQLSLPSPTIKASPAEEQLVGLPTWLWLGREDWDVQSSTASVPGVSVTAEARPMSVDWSMGDDSTHTCDGPGTPYRADSKARKAVDPKSSSPDCGHTYRSSSAGEPRDAYAVSATVHWSVTWSGAGQSGSFPGLTTTSTAAFRVAESQAVNTDGR